MFRHVVVLTFVALLGVSACSSDVSTSDTNALATAVTKATEVPSTEARSDPAPADPAATTAGTETPAPDAPMVLGTPKRIGDGLLEDWSPDGTAVLVGRVDDTLSKEGCEGAKEPVFFLQPVNGGTSTVAFPGHTEMNGSFVGTQPVTNDVVMLSGCEGYLGDLSVARQSADGRLRDPRLVVIADTAQAAELTGVSSLSLDGSALLLTGKAFADDVEHVVSTRIDLATGASSAIETGGRGGAHIAEATAGRIVVSDGKTVYVLGNDGSLIRSYDGSDFAVSHDGTHLAVVGNGALGVVAIGDEIMETVSLPKPVESALLLFSPDGRTVAVLSYDDAGSVAVVRGGTVHVVAEGGSYGRMAWNPAGKGIAFNRFSGDLAVEDVMVAAEAVA